MQSRSRHLITHRVLYYLNQRTSTKYPEWRNCTLNFFYKLFELMESNPSIVLDFKRDDGLYLYNGSDKIVYLHCRQRHFLAHCGDDYLLAENGDELFATKHDGSWPVMWRVDKIDEVDSLINFLQSLPSYELAEQEKASRTIPVWVQEFILERDNRTCQSCRSKENLCFDHIIPFSKGGASDHPNNIQLLCSKCNSEKSANFWPVKTM